MKILAAVTATPVAATSIATGDWIYLVYIVAVLSSAVPKALIVLRRRYIL
jgi:hypothetical protein